MSNLPQFRNGVRVVPYYGGSGRLWRVDCVHKDAKGAPLQCGVDVDDGVFADSGVLDAALAHLNKHIEGWPQHPVTIERVRELAAAWAVESVTVPQVRDSG